MTWLTDLGVIDIRDQLPRADWSIGTRPDTTSETWHYNGPAVPIERQSGAGLLAQLRADAEWQMRPGWGGTVHGADGLMYHLVFAIDGTVYQTRDLDDLLWHCAHADGNGHGLALHLPLGVGQWPSIPQLTSLFSVSNVLRHQYGIPFNRIIGHKEWKQATACPGPMVMQHLVAYRSGLQPAIAPTVVAPELRKWRIKPTLTSPALVRQKPARFEADGSQVTIAGRMKPGTILYVDVVKVGQAVEGNTLWMHMAKVEHEQADLGFVSATLGDWVA